MIGAARLVLVMTALAGAAPVMAQTQAQQDRLNKLGQFIVTAPMCESLGMRVDPDLAERSKGGVGV